MKVLIGVIAILAMLYGESLALACRDSGNPQAAPDAAALYEQALKLEQEGCGPQAVRLYRQVIGSEHSGRAARRLGQIYNTGMPGVAVDYAESLKWHNLARMLGEDVPIKDAGPAPASGEALFAQAAELERQDEGREAVKLYVTAARRGYGKAALRLGQIYEKGIPGVSLDLAEAIKWYHAARAMGETAPIKKP